VGHQTVHIHSLCTVLVDPSDTDSRRRRQPVLSDAAASRKTDGAPPSQPKLWGAAAAEILQRATACIA